MPNDVSRLPGRLLARARLRPGVFARAPRARPLRLATEGAASELRRGFLVKYGPRPGGLLPSGEELLQVASAGLGDVGDTSLVHGLELFAAPQRPYRCVATATTPGL